MEDSLEMTNLDSMKFDSRKYLTNFLKTNNLNQLIQKNNELHQSIRSCDHDIQNLVFENYQKFLTSIDTVKKMKGSINKVEQRISNLNVNMTKINDLASNIHSALSTKHEAIQELDIVGRDLARLKQVCEFPAVLKQELEQKEDFSKSVQLYQECWPLIDNFKNESLIKGIYRDVIECLNEIRFILFKRQKDESNLKNQKQILKSLVVIQEDQELVIKTYIKGIKDSIAEEIKKNNLQQKLADKHINEQEKQKSLIDTFLEDHQYQVTIEELQAKQVEANSLNQQQLPSEQTSFCVIRNIVHKLQEETRFLLQELYDVIANSEQHKWKQKEELGILNHKEQKHGQQGSAILNSLQQIAEGMVRDIVGLVLEEMSKYIVATFSEKSMVSNEGIMQVYRDLREQLQEIFELNVSQELRTTVSDKVMTNMQEVFLKQVYSEFAQLKINAINLIILIKEKCLAIDQNENSDSTLEEDYSVTKKAMFSLLTEFKNRFYTLLSICMVELKPLAATANQESEIYIQQELFQQINAQFLDFLKLLLQIICLDPNKLSLEWVQQIGLTATMASPSTNFPTNLHSQPTQLYLSTESLLLRLADTPPSACYFILVNHFLLSCSQGAVFGKCAELLAKVFMGMDAVALTALESAIPNNYIPLNLANFLQFRTRSLARKEQQSNIKLEISEKMIDKIVPQLMKFFHTELLLLFPSGKKFFLTKKPSLLSRADNTEMEKMLAKKAHHILFRSILDADQCILSMFKGVLKAKLQNIRKMKWMSKQEAEQRLADTAFFAQIAMESVLVDEEPVIVGLLFEILAALEDKVQSDDKINVKEVETIVIAARNQIKS